MRKLGYVTNPVTFVDGQAIVGFNPKAIAKALGLDAEKVQRNLGRLSDAETLRRLSVMVDALAKLVRSLPKDAYLKDYDGRIAPLMVSPRSEFHYQQFVLDARKSGVWLADELFKDLPRREVDWVDSSDNKKLADYGDRVAQGYREWAKGFTQKDMGQRVTGYYGDITMSDLLNVALGHIGQHIRTHYKNARKNAGIEPPVPLPAEIFEGIPSLPGDSPVAHKPGPA